jgi:hypothetical protein
LIVVLVVGFIIYAISTKKPTQTSAPVAPVPQTVAPVAAPVVPKHEVKKHKGKHSIHCAPGTTTKPDGAPAAESANDQ